VAGPAGCTTAARAFFSVKDPSTSTLASPPIRRAGGAYRRCLGVDERARRPLHGVEAGPLNSGTFPAFALIGEFYERASVCRSVQSIDLFIDQGKQSVHRSMAIPDRRARFMKQCPPPPSEIGLMIERVFALVKPER